MDNQGKVAVVIPYYHSILEETEKISYRQCINKLSRYAIILLVPDNMLENEYPTEEKVQILKVKSAYLQSVNSYNRMMMDSDFYELFVEYEYILIYQLDALVIEDKLNDFCKLGYDYIGAPWLHGMFAPKHLECGVRYVGNGGFSLRKVGAFLNVLRQKTVDFDSWTEDVFWSNCDSESFKVAPIEIALSFAFETQVRKCYERNGYRLPFGCHAWMKYDVDFWKTYLPPNNNPIKDVVYNCEPKDLVTNYVNNRFLMASAELVKEWAEKRGIDNIYIFGTGSISKIYSLPIANAKFNNFCYLDNNQAIWGQKLYNRDIVDPQTLLQKSSERNLIIVAISEYEEIYNQLRKMGISLQDEVITYIDFAKEIDSIWYEEF